MSPRKPSDRDRDAGLEAYRLAAHAAADAHFDERALETQRHRILERLAHLGKTARVIRFPVAPRGTLPSSGVNRRWVSASAAAGLLVGLLGGQWLHLRPQTPARPVTGLAATTSALPSPAFVPVLASTAADDGLLGEVDMAVRFRSAAELRVLDELTPLHEPR